ncbi:CBD9-like protein [Pyrenochaeta sp. DS3sAY3a]|nr:CBD9-like protein [Pyrenochaeta sp. DS3sAY3a]
MRFTKTYAAGAALAGAVSAQEASKYFDPATGITFSSITHNNGLTTRVALPANGTSSDAILQIITPSAFAWCGLAWGGHMTNNPLSVTWATGEATGEKVIVSSRMAFGYYAIPYTYDGAEYTNIPTGTSVNATHWQITTRCRGCTQWSSADGDFNLHNEPSAVLAYACSSVPPDTPSRNDSSFNIHEQFGIWSHDFTIAKNASYGSWVSGAGAGEANGVFGRRWAA